MGVSWHSFPAAAGVRYPVLDVVRTPIVAEHNRLVSTGPCAGDVTSYFGRNIPELRAIRDSIRSEKPIGPLKLLIVGTGIALLGNQLEVGRYQEVPITILEWAGLLAGLGYDFTIDAVDVSAHAGELFADMHSAPVYSFRIDGEDCGVGMWAREIFGDQFWSERPGDALPPSLMPLSGGVARFPSELLRSLRFSRRSVVHPLPDTGYQIVDYRRVDMYLREIHEQFRRIETPASRLAEDNLLLNMAAGAWVHTDAFIAEGRRKNCGLEPICDCHSIYRYRPSSLAIPHWIFGNDGRWSPEATRVAAAR